MLTRLIQVKVAVEVRWLMQVGRWAENLPLNSVREMSKPEGAGVCWTEKERRWYAEALIPFCNLYLCLLRANQRVLHVRQWLSREQEIFHLLPDTNTKMEVDGLVLRQTRIAGRTLSVELTQSYWPVAVALAARALRSLHSVTSNGHSITHGDATADNVIVDLGKTCAQWIDFETVHCREICDDIRRADDLHALAFSCVSVCPTREYEVMTNALVRGYGTDRAISNALHDRVKVVNNNSRILRQLAWPRLTIDAQDELNRALLLAFPIERPQRLSVGSLNQ